MLKICRAEDGELFQVNATLRDIERTGSLETFLHHEINIEPNAALAFLSDGRRLTNGNIRELAGMPDQAIFVFNKNYIDDDFHEVLRQLRVIPPLQPPVEDTIAATPPFRPAQLASSFLRTANLHHDHLNRIYDTLQRQYDAMRVATTSLDRHVLTIVETFNNVAETSRVELEKQATLLAGAQADLDLIKLVKVHYEFLSPNVRKAIEAGGEPRTLGDYVSTVKMKQVADTCARTHEDLRLRFGQVEQAIRQLSEGASYVRSIVADHKLLEDGIVCRRRAKDVFDRVSDRSTAIQGSVPDPDSILQELGQCDTSMRNELQYMTEIKNALTEQCIGTFIRVSHLNSEIVQIPAALVSLQASFRGKNSFSHIQRLHTMLYAYGATVIEIVRRKEFSRFFYQRAQSILEVMAKLSASERKKRQVYRGEVHGQLPFDTLGMDDPVPTIDFSPTGNPDSHYSLEREDVLALLRVFDDLDQYGSQDSLALGAVRECRAALDKLVGKMDNLESGFDKIAERSLLSASRLSLSRRRSLEAEEQMFQDLVEQLRTVQDSKARQDTLFQEERVGMQMEIQKLKSELADMEVAVSSERGRADRLERELHQARAQIEGDSIARRIVEERNADISKDMEKQRLELVRALADATEQARAAELVKQKLTQAKAEAEDVKNLEKSTEERMRVLLEEQAKHLKELEEARARGEDLEAQIQAARTESEEVHLALREARLDKDKLLKAQASEHDRIIRDHIAEADGDRAVLERQFHELKALQEHTERQVRDLKGDVEIANADAVGLREELQRVEHELRDARHVERLLREDLKAGQLSQSMYEQQVEECGRLIAQILNVAIQFRDTHVKALRAAQAMVVHPGSSKNQTQANQQHANGSPPRSDSPTALFTSMRQSAIITEALQGASDEPSIDPSDSAAALEMLRSFDHDHFLEAIAKAGSTIRKWQKQCRDYREKAKGKISFRNFAKGDLALFLPTRNSVSKPWAAFNVSFPHYFLQATGHLADQLKMREWIVARITSITERIVSAQDPSSNPYGLGDGVKYYMLEVEDWTQPSPSKRRANSKKATHEKSDSEVRDHILPSSPGILPLVAPGPPEDEVEETFRVTQPPNSRLFPVRQRADSSPSSRPSSLSRLLAQAPLTSEPHQSEQMDHQLALSAPMSGHKVASPTFPFPQHWSEDKEPIPVSPPPPPSPQLPSTTTLHSQQTSTPSPLRPGSRASRLSTASKFSGARLPVLAAGKAAPTTALSEEHTAMPSSAPASDGNPFGSPSSPSSGGTPEGMGHMINERKRTVSLQPSRTYAASTSSLSTPQNATEGMRSTATSTLANLANSLGFGRRRSSVIHPHHQRESSRLGRVSETAYNDPNTAQPSSG
ncbi:hypothetical protein M378DRAFT_13754 [Amanita muscaria Koide BX008]|uniref:Autophagy-related protein 11 n=1 Tax=Amanita muscaria (strain Koide BX008) TaxID=946122 RepID=A0A0C2T3K7_AMAMK|nr:hypothetical protein M378DRAFT_13754 [Amanita muscaria Koide BX008]